MSFAKIICRIETRIPICLEKHETIEQMGRFTLRDEGLTLGSGKVLKYKPIKVKTLPDPVPKTTEGSSEETKGTQEQKDVLGGGGTHKVSELIYDLETGETVSKEEYMKRQNARELDNVDEEDYDDEEDEDEDEEAEEEETKPEATEKIGTKKEAD
jgi:hypothetical protein